LPRQMLISLRRNLESKQSGISAKAQSSIQSYKFWPGLIKLRRWPVGVNQAIAMVDPVTGQNRTRSPVLPHCAAMEESRTNP